MERTGDLRQRRDHRVDGEGVERHQPGEHDGELTRSRAALACLFAPEHGQVPAAGAEWCAGACGGSISAGSSGSSAFSHRATTLEATALPTTLVADRPMSRKWSTARISSSPASGMWNSGRVAAITTRLARGTPAMPLDVTISTRSMVSCWARLRWIPYASAMNSDAKVMYIIDPSRLNE